MLAHLRGFGRLQAYIKLGRLSKCLQCGDGARLRSLLAEPGLRRLGPHKCLFWGGRARPSVEVRGAFVGDWGSGHLLPL